MLQAVLMFIPQEAYLPLMVLAGLLMIIGLRQIAAAIFISVIAMAILGPFIDAIVGSLPLWAVLLLLTGAFLSLIRLVLGRRIFDNVASFLIYDLIRMPFRIFFWLLGLFFPPRRR
jgi:hypothetical protein